MGNAWATRERLHLRATFESDSAALALLLMRLYRQPQSMTNLESSIRRTVLLGPQPEFESLRLTLRRLSIGQRVAVVTAGWEEDEGEDAALMTILPAGSVNLRLFGRTEQIFAEDPEVIQQLQRRQDELRHLRDVYRMRLALALRAARQISEFRNDLVDFSVERQSAIEIIRQLDRQYFLRTSQVCDEYDRRLDMDHRPGIARHRAEIKRLIDSAKALVIAGGHAAIVLNRLRIFDLLGLNNEMPVIAWSAGAMAISQQVVFFHDGLPQGDTNPEILRAGIGLVNQILPLPDGSRRLQLDNQARMALFADRFDAYDCVILDPETWLDRVDGTWTACESAKRLTREGSTERFVA